MKQKLIISALGILLLSAAVYFWQSRPSSPTQQDVIHNVFGGQNNYEVVITSTNVTAQLLHERREIEFDVNTNNHGKSNGYLIDPPVAVTSEQAGQIRQLLQSPSSFEFLFLSGAAKACIPVYGVLFNFHSDQETVRVALCFNCDIIAVFTGEDVNSDGVGGEDFDPSHGKFIAIAKSIFPNDPEIQSLKERKH